MLLERVFLRQHLGDGEAVEGVRAERRSMVPRFALFAVGLAVSGLFGYLALRNVRWNQTWQAFQDTHYGWLVPATALMVLAFFIRAVRWWALYDHSRRPPLGPVVRATFVGYIGNNLLPARAGEAAKTVALNRMTRTPVAETVATILIERIFDVLSLILLLFVMLPWLPGVTWLRSAGIFAAVVFAIVVVIAVAVLRFGERPLRLLLRPLAWMPFVPREFAEHAPFHFLHGLVGVLRPRIAAVAFFWTTLSWIVLGVAYWLVMLAFDLGLSPLAGELVVIGIGLAMVLPSSPAALGVFEAATVVVLNAYSIDNSRAISYALLLHALNVAPLFVVAIAGPAARRLRRFAAARKTAPGLERVLR
jgi:glycosyltransferase 2 family protein